MRKLSELDGEKTALIDFHLQPLQDIFGNACVGEVWGTVLFCASSSCLYLPFPSSAIPSLHKIALPNISLTCWLDRLANPRSMPTRLFSSRQQVIFVCVLKPLLAYLVVSCIPHARAYAPRPTPKIRAAAYPFRFTRINYSARTKHIPGTRYLFFALLPSRREYSAHIHLLRKNQRGTSHTRRKKGDSCVLMGLLSLLCRIERVGQFDRS